MTYKKSYNNTAFTLIELAVVLVILGLLVGGILVGREMIHASKLRKVTLAIHDSVTAVSLFSDKFSELPGDFTRATDYWGADPNGCPSHNTRIPKQETCNGNGDGVIGNSYLGTGGTDQRFEYFRFWQHLNNAQLYGGNFTGVTGAEGEEHFIVGENIPIIYDNIGIGAFLQFNSSNEPYLINNSLFPDGKYGNVFVVGGQKPDDDPLENSANFMTPSEARNIDIKIDDGFPNQGKLIGYPYNRCSTAATSDDLDADYSQEGDEKLCSFYVRDIIPRL